MAKSKVYIHPTAVVENGADLQDNVKVWHFCHVRKDSVLEEGVSLGKNVYIDVGVRVGKKTRIQNGVSVYAGLTIAPWNFIGPNVTFTNDASPRTGSKNWKVIETNLEIGVSIGAGAIIKCGITLGAFSMIGAGAVVTKSVPPFHLAIGFPSKCLQMVCACGRTFLPIATKNNELLRDCCKKNLVPDLYQEVLKLVGNRSRFRVQGLGLIKP